MNKHQAQTTVTIILALALIGIVAGYIYYGMQQARIAGTATGETNTTAEEGVVSEEVLPGEDFPQGGTVLAEEERERIIEELNAQPVRELTDAELEKINQELNAQPALELSEEELNRIMEELNATAAASSQE